MATSTDTQTVSASSQRPLVAVVTDVKTIAPHRFYSAGEKYCVALVQAANVIPMLVPAMTDRVAIAEWLHRVDGVFLPGAYSNVHPRHFDQTDELPDTEHDEHRDALTLELIRQAIALGKPLFGVCRGMQEMNVALGGSLHQNLHLVGRYQEHREDKTQPLDVQYGPAHSVELVADGVLTQLTGSRQLMVNSVHTQGVDQLAPGLQVEATAEDGLVEAFRVTAARSFAVGVQWHPEWKVLEHPGNRALFEAFGAACRTTTSVTS